LLDSNGRINPFPNAGINAAPSAVRFGARMLPAGLSYRFHTPRSRTHTKTQTQTLQQIHTQENTTETQEKDSTNAN